MYCVNHEDVSEAHTYSCITGMRESFVRNWVCLHSQLVNWSNLTSHTVHLQALIYVDVRM